MLESFGPSRFVSHKASISGEIDSRKDSHPTRFFYSYWDSLYARLNRRQGKELQENSHSCEEGGAHLRISFCYLLMNLKKKLLKKLLKWADKNQNNFNIYNVFF